MEWVPTLPPFNPQFLKWIKCLFKYLNDSGLKKNKDG